MKNNIYKKYFKKPTKSDVLNVKLLILVHGLDFDFQSIKNWYPDLKSQYKVNKIRVSDRHFISTKSEERNYIPDELILEKSKNRSVVKVYYLTNSPFLFTIRNKKFIILDKKSRKVLPVNIHLVPLLNYSKREDGQVAMDEFVNTVGLDKITIIPFDGCENWIYGEQCTFCGANPSRTKSTGVKLSITNLKGKFNNNYRDWWNNKRIYMKKNVTKSFKSLIKEKFKPHLHLAVMSGNILDLDFAWDIAFDLVESIKDKINLSKIDSYFNLMPPNDFKKINQCKKYGFQTICFNLECYTKKYFKKVCPGKELRYGYDKMIQALTYSVKIFGRGQVRTNFVLGSEPINLLIKGAKKLAKLGIVSDYTVFFPRPGSLWAKKKPLTPDEILLFTKKLVVIYKKYFFHPYCCALSSRSSIANEYYNLIYDR